MKHIIKIISVLLAVVLLFCACSSKGNNDDNVKVISDVVHDNDDKFADFMSFDDIYNDVANIDLYLEPDFSDLTEKIEKDDESSTAVKNYYDGDKLVYKKYEGYGEDSFDYITESKGNRDIVVKYINQDGERYSVNIDCDDYSLAFKDLNKKSKYGADSIYATAYKQNKNDFKEYATYSYENGKIYLVNGAYYDYDGYHNYSAQPTDDKGNVEAEDTVKYKLAEKVNIDKNLYTMLKDYRVGDIEICIGNHSLEYTQAKDKIKTWYIVSDVYAVFKSRDKAIEFSDKYNVDVFVPKDEDYYVAKFEGATLPVSKDYSDFFDFFSEEIDDFFYCSVILDKNAEVTNLKSSSAMLVYY